MTDIKWIARGYWDNHFYWRVCPRAEAAIIVSAVSLTMFGLFAITAISLDLGQVPPVIRALALASLLISTASALWTIIIHFKERDLFVEAVQNNWETKHELPGRDTIMTFLQTRRED